LAKRKKSSPVELTGQFFLSRIERYNSRLNAFSDGYGRNTRSPPALRAEKRVGPAPRTGRGGRRPLLGIPITLKDNIWTRGIRNDRGIQGAARILSPRKTQPWWGGNLPARGRHPAWQGQIYTNSPTVLHPTTRTTARPRKSPGRSGRHPRGVSRRRLCRRDCGGTLRRVGGHGYGRLDSDPFRDVRNRRPETKLLGVV